MQTGPLLPTPAVIVPLVLGNGTFRVASGPFGMEIADLATGRVGYPLLDLTTGGVVMPEGTWPEEARQLVLAFCASQGFALAEPVAGALLA